MGLNTDNTLTVNAFHSCHNNIAIFVTIISREGYKPICYQ